MVFDLILVLDEVCVNLDQLLRKEIDAVLSLKVLRVFKINGAGFTDVHHHVDDEDDGLVDAINVAFHDARI